ncbi:MAG: 3'(2'),5'-bisphosphate nucleotidase CysQ, partial [Oculatellaceae cyanobacterium Prado106]|nr:3'(2'),5'-bisphosphate nucleotidase CysQ [Oculatellaceae cyanobacterium Prado106]
MEALQSMAGKPVEEILAIARTIGWGAAKILSAFYRGEPLEDGIIPDLNIQDKQDGPVTAADLAVNHYVLNKLESVFGDSFGYLSEETYKVQAEPQPLPQDWVWILDPLDGTRDFIDKTGEYA